MDNRNTRNSEIEKIAAIDRLGIFSNFQPERSHPQNISGFGQLSGAISHSPGINKVPTDGRTTEILQLAHMSRNLSGANVADATLAVAHAWRELFLLRWGKALTLIAEIEPCLSDLPPKSADILRCDISILYAAILVLQDDSSTALSLVLSILRQGVQCPRAFLVSPICRFVYWRTGDLANFYSVGRTVSNEYTGNLQAMAAIFDLTVESALEMQLLRFDSAKRLANEALEISQNFSGRHTALATFPTTVLAQILYEQGYVQEVEQMLLDQLPSIRLAGTIESAVRAYPMLAKIAASQQKKELAFSLLTEAEALGEKRGWTRLIAASLSTKIDLLLQENIFAETEILVERLERLANQQGVGNRLARVELTNYYCIARSKLALVQHPTCKDVARLRQTHYEAVSRHNLYEATAIGILLAESLFLIGEQDEAIAVFWRALKVGSSVGLYQSFIDSGARTEKLLQIINSITPTSSNGLRELQPYVGSLLMRWQLRWQPKSEQPKAAPSTLLSERECRILELMSRGLSNKEISRCLGITPETVKSHAKNFFVKLAVKTRTGAVTKAAHLGYLCNYEQAIS